MQLNLVVITSGNGRVKWIRNLALVCLAAVLSACASQAGSIPFEQLSGNLTVAGGEYTIGVGDLLSIQVFEDEKMSGRMRVRSDGRISLPLLNDIQAAGKAPAALATELEGVMKSLVINPRVTVIVEESQPLSISILGEVRAPGQLTLMRGAGVAQALATAGGLTDFAHKDRIFVLRNDPTPTRIQFTYDQLTKGTGAASAFLLRVGDVIVVE